jgi:hypothetical protein
MEGCGVAHDFARFVTSPDETVSRCWPLCECRLKDLDRADAQHRVDFFLKGAVACPKLLLCMGAVTV